MATDELMVDMAAAAEQAKADAAVEMETEAAFAESAGGLESTIDPVNNDFWDDGDEEVSEAASAGEREDLDVVEEGASARDGGKTITYKANGKEVSLNISDLQNDPAAREALAKQLALVDGARKAFSDKNKLRQQMKKQAADTAQLREYKESWDKLETLKDDPDQLYRVLTGRSLDDMINHEIERRIAYQNASDEDRKIMEYEERFRKMEERSRREEMIRQQQIEEAKAEKYEAQKRATQNDLEREFFKYEFNEEDPVTANRLKKMLWRSALGDIQDYRKQGYKMSQKMVAKAFRDNAKALQSFYSKSVDEGVKSVVSSKKAGAQEKAEKAATKNYSSSNTDFDQLAGKDPLSIFQAFRRGRK